MHATPTSGSCSAGPSARTRASPSRWPRPTPGCTAAELVIREASWRYDNGLPCGEQRQHRQVLAADAGFQAADQAMQTHGGLGYAKEYDVERYWREARLMRIAPISQEMVLNYVAEHVLGLPRSY